MNAPKKKSASEVIADLEANGMTKEQIAEHLDREDREVAASADDSASNEVESRAVESLEMAFREDLQEIFQDLPRVKAVLDQKERAALDLTPSEAQVVSAKTLWLLSSWVRSLAAEVDRLHDELGRLAGNDDDSHTHS